MDFLETLSTIRGSEASVQTLFGGEGQGVRGSAARQSPAYLAKLKEAADLLAGVMRGTRPRYLLEAALSTNDFPLLFADILDRQVLATYREWPATWPAIAKRATVRDFRSVKLFPPAYGADTRLIAVDENDQYEEATINEQAALTYSVTKFGRRIGFSWEALINDDLEQLTGIPERFGRAARRTEQRFVTELYVDVNGPHASLYTSGNKNIINTTNGAATTNPPISIAALQDAFKVLAAMKDESGEPMMIEAVTLVVPPALEIVARNIMNATQLWVTTAAAGGVPPNPATAGDQRLIVENWMRNRVTLVVDPYIPMTATTANGNTSWFLFANPSTGRPALIIGFLRGHEEPEIFIREPNARRVGGAGSDPMNGSFDTDSVDYKVRHVVGGRIVDGKATVASNGSGS